MKELNVNIRSYYGIKEVRVLWKITCFQDIIPSKFAHIQVSHHHLFGASDVMY